MIHAHEIIMITEDYVELPLVIHLKSSSFFILFQYWCNLMGNRKKAGI